MSANVMIITSVCRTDGCSAAGFQNVFEQESDVDFVVSCGQCQNIVTDISMVEKE